MPRLNGIGPEGKGKSTGRGIGICENSLIKGELGKGMGLKCKSGGGRGKGKRLKYFIYIPNY